MFQQSLGPEAAIQKLKHFCSYQERCHQEVREKLYQLKVSSKYHDEIISTLIEEDYLNEERFAIQFVGGKFRLKQWGRVKIKGALQQKQVSTYCINKGLQEIDETAYEQTLAKLLEKKYESLKGEHYLVRQKKTTDHLLQKGYELPLINSTLQGYLKSKKENN